MQEVGGKNYETCTIQVPGFINTIANLFQSLGYTTGRAYLDLDFDTPDTYALGSLYFVKDSCKLSVEQYDFKTGRFGKLEPNFDMITEDLSKCSKLRKAKFPKYFWPTIRWTRKGYMHCRFKFNKTPFDFVNVHLFHDDSNIALVHENPSLYSENRKRALDFVIEELRRTEENQNNTLFLFGDLNFRLDPASFLNRITEGADQRHDSVVFTESDDIDDETTSLASVEPNTIDLLKSDDRKDECLRRTVSAIEFRRSPNPSKVDIQSNCVLRIEKKRFDYFNHMRLLKEWECYLEDDKEALNFPSLRELKIHFPPTYPWSEDPEDSEMLMKTRAPAWCDRILMNSRAYDMVCTLENVVYDSIGKDVCMGDHKVVSICHFSFSFLIRLGWT
uniref:inositol-polyphosphate 5-phosphatase n=1 Tax=Syphacia muris TaxID=451379 RepID=A0A0N5ALK2_9BILA